ncbi:hypothetical protein [Methanoculleus horonobensis]|uniref:hypothetical protein n=1 Tax=Methanoculleus horonobensis TaxID=528314 RepID=UPI0008312755|nr:hypothetical protein [Methanoculleus horonobensis]
MRLINSSVTRWRFRTFPSLAQMVQYCTEQQEAEEIHQYTKQYTEVTGILTVTEAGPVLRSHLGEAPGACHEYFVVPYAPEPEIELLDSPGITLVDAEGALRQRMDELEIFCEAKAVMALYMRDAEGVLVFLGVFAQSTWEESYLPPHNVALNALVPGALVMSFLQAASEPTGSASTLQAAMWRVVRETRVCSGIDAGRGCNSSPAGRRARPDEA